MLENHVYGKARIVIKFWHARLFQNVDNGYLHAAAMGFRDSADRTFDTSAVTVSLGQTCHCQNQSLANSSQKAEIEGFKSIAGLVVVRVTQK